MSEKILSITSREGNKQTVQVDLDGGKMKDLIVGLKSMKEQVNDVLTKYVNEDAEKYGKQQQARQLAEDDDEDSEEPDQDDATRTKRLKS